MFRFENIMDRIYRDMYKIDADAATTKQADELKRSLEGCDKVEITIKKVASRYKHLLN